FGRSFTLFADDLGLSSLFDLRFEFNFLNHDDRCNDRLRSFMDLDALADLDVGHVSSVFKCQPADIDLDKVGRLRRFAENLDLTHRLRKHRTLFLKGFGLTDEVNRHRHLDLFTAGKAAEIGVNQAAADRVDLAVLKDHIALAFTGDVERENGIDSRIGPQHGSKIFEIGRERQIFRTAAVDDNGDLALCT